MRKKIVTYGVILPESWKLTSQQDLLLGTLIDKAGKYTDPAVFCLEIYGEDIGRAPAPAKLRVLMQRVRDIVAERTDGTVEILVKRNSGWKITKRDGLKFKKIIDDAE